jgi:hypothetical protein
MILRLAAAAAVCLSLVLSASAPASAAPRPVPCSSIGSGKYACDWYVPGDGRTGGAKVMVNQQIVGYLHKGRNWILCQQRGAMTRDAAGDRNAWYGWTQSDHGGAGWVSAVEARGGDDDGPFSGAPNCRGAHGPAPAWGGVWGAQAQAPAPPPPTPKPKPKPKKRKPKPKAAPACSSLREDQQVRVSFRRRVENFQYDKTVVGPGGELWRARDKVYETGAIRINASTCKSRGRWRVLGPLAIELDSKGLDDAGHPDGPDHVEGFGIGMVGGRGPRERGGPYLDISWTLCSEASWATAAGLVLPHLNRIPKPAAKFVVNQLIGWAVRYANDRRLSCVFPGRFRVALSASRRGTLLYDGRAIHLAPRYTETPRPGSRNVVEVWREIPEVH